MSASERKRWVVAVDGGGSKISIAAQLCSDDAPPPSSLESARRWTFAHCGSAHASVWSASQQHLTEALSAAAHALTLSEPGCPIRHVLFALAGAGRQADRSKVLDWARTLSFPFECASISCVSDIEPLIDYRRVPHQGNGIGGQQAGDQERAGTQKNGDEDRPLVAEPAASVAVILGTGSMVAARDRHRRVIRAGGWGPHLGDECSGGALGLAALRSVTEWLDAGGQNAGASPLVRAVLAALPGRSEWLPGLDDNGSAEPGDSGTLTAEDRLDCDRLGSILIETAANRGQAAALARVILELALEGQDADGLRLMKPQLERLSWQIEQVVRRAELNTAGFELVFSGGLVSNHGLLRDAVIESCRARGLAPRDTVFADPLLAALRLAFAGHSPD